MQTAVPKFTFSVKTMGCKANIYDSLVLEKQLLELGGSRKPQNPDVFILNSCTVTAGADKQARRETLAVKKKSPNTYTIVTGCYAHVSEEEVNATPSVDSVITNDKKNQIPEILSQKFKLTHETKPLSNDIYWGQLPIDSGKTRAFLKIQEGCNDYCTYCIIPYARGKSRSIPMKDILKETQRLANAGVKEMVLTGINIADYGKEFGYSLEDLIEAILTHTSLPRLRLTSLDPEEITPRLLNLMKTHKALMPHFHVSLQNANSRVLRMMKRNYRQEEVISSLKAISDTGTNIFVGMDYIAGFPSETDEEHQENVALLKELPWTRLHVFPYSERKGTPAIRIKGAVPMAKRKERVRELIELSKEKQKAFVKRFVGKTLDDVLIETSHEIDGNQYLVGHSGNYLRVIAKVKDKNEASKHLNQIVSVKIQATSLQPSLDWTLEGTLA